MPLGWILSFKVNDVEADLACPWISHKWFDLSVHYSKKMTAAAHVTAEAAKDALKADTAARHELHLIRGTRRLSAWIESGDLEPQEIHALLYWISAKEPNDLMVRLIKFTKDDWSDSTDLTQATFKKSFPIGQRVYGPDYIFDFQLGRGVEWEDTE
jgi:hypothetical protein